MLNPTHHRTTGFTLIEILIAAGIFGVGLVAVASIFPTAIQLQKQTIEEIRGAEFAATARALVLQRGFDERAVAVAAPAPPVTPATPEIPRVFSAPDAVQGSTVPTPPIAPWSPADRSTGSLEPVGTAGTQFDYGGRNLFWTPLFIDRNRQPASGTSLPDALENRFWNVFLFISRGEPVDPDPTITPAGYTRTTAGSVNAYALDNSQGQDAIDSNTGRSIIPGVALLDVTAAAGTPARFNFTNTGLPPAEGSSATTGRIVRIGDGILGIDGTTYVVSDSDNAGVAVLGPITVPDGATQVWAVHPGASGESAFVDLIQLVDSSENDNLVYIP